MFVVCSPVCVFCVLFVVSYLLYVCVASCLLYVFVIYFVMSFLSCILFVFHAVFMSYCVR